MKYKLSDILFSMGPCSEAIVWITHHMHFETFEEAVRECPDAGWLVWVLRELDDGGIWDELNNELEHAEAKLPVCTYRAVSELQRSFFLKPANLERFACGLVHYAQRKGIAPQ